MNNVAALFVETGGHYFGLPNVDPYDEHRDARTYNGPEPVVAHPPCQLWVNFAALNFKRYGGQHNRPGNDGGCFPVRVRAGETFFLEIQVMETGGQVEAREGDDWGLLKTETQRRITDRKVGPHPEMPHDWHESGDGGMYLCHLYLEGGDMCLACEAISDAEECPECGVTKGHTSKDDDDANE